MSPSLEAASPKWLASNTQWPKPSHKTSGDSATSSTLPPTSTRNTATPAAYPAPNLIAYADSLTHVSYSGFIMPDGWDATEAGTRYAQIVFDTLKQIPVNRNDPDNSNNVYDAWLDGTGQLYNGVRPS